MEIVLKASLLQSSAKFILFHPVSLYDLLKIACSQQNSSQFGKEKTMMLMRRVILNPFDVFLNSQGIYMRTTDNTYN